MRDNNSLVRYTSEALFFLYYSYILYYNIFYIIVI